MRVQIRIVAGHMRGRKLSCTVDPNLRPTPQRFREALFSILGNAVPDRLFVDVFAGTGVNGLEALSRGASGATFVERDFRLVKELQRHADEFGVADQAEVVRADVYRWVEQWQPPAEPVNVFVSPPFVDFDRRPEELLAAVAGLQAKVAPGSVLVLQVERHPVLDPLVSDPQWEHRRYGRNELLIWVRDADGTPA